MTAKVTLEILAASLAKVLDTFAGCNQLTYDRRADGSARIRISADNDDAMRAVARAFNLKVEIVEFCSPSQGDVWWCRASKGILEVSGRHNEGKPPTVLRELVANAAEDLATAIGGGS